MVHVFRNALCAAKAEMSMQLGATKIAIDQGNGRACLRNGYRETDRRRGLPLQRPAGSYEDRAGIVTEVEHKRSSELSICFGSGRLEVVRKRRRLTHAHAEAQGRNRSERGKLHEIGNIFG